MHHRSIQLFLVCALAFAGAASGASLDEEKLRLLSCEKGAGSAKAVDWLNQFSAANAEDGQRIAGPLKLGKACLKNVSVTAAFGAMVVQGEICNARLDEFTDALAAAGTTLGKQVSRKVPGFVMGMEEGARTYVIADRMAGKYAFTCSVSEGGAQ